MYGYIYKTTNLLNDKIYIGKKKGEFTEKYKGSGKYLKNAINKYGVENFKVEVIEYCETLEEQNEKEKYWIAYYRNKNAEMYNIADGGDGGDIFSCLPQEQLQEIKNYISYCNKNGICGNKGKHLSKEHREKISRSNLGKKKSLEAIEKQRQAILGKPAWNKGLTKDDPRVAKYCRKPGIYKHSEETRNKISNNCKGKLKGRIWVNNGVKSKHILKEELETYLQNNYKLGMVGWKGNKNE